MQAALSSIAPGKFKVLNRNVKKNYVFCLQTAQC